MSVDLVSYDELPIYGAVDVNSHISRGSYNLQEMPKKIPNIYDKQLIILAYIILTNYKDLD